MIKLRVRNLGKAYKQYRSPWGRLAEWLLPFLGRRHELHWVLKNVNFEVMSGDSVGIVGLNGAGKSTLLKLIAGLSRPSSGSIETYGTVVALLELGMGFHDDFTGRQNVVMAAQLMGMTAQEISNLMPSIEAFSEIGEYFDQPLRIYSTGMKVRLAFSVATSVRPDILIIDEALSVGDSYFQHKSFSRIRAFRDLGTTLLVVSHDRYAIQILCDHALLLYAGKQLLFGTSQEVLDRYHAIVSDIDHALIRQEKLESGYVRTSSGSGEAQVTEIQLLNAQSQPADVINVGEMAEMRIRIYIKCYLPRLVFGFLIRDHFGQAIYGINTHRLGIGLHKLQAGESIELRVHFDMNIGKGSYSVSTALSAGDSHLDQNCEWCDYALMFNVLNRSFPDFVGTSLLNPTIAVSRSSQVMYVGLIRAQLGS